MHRLNATAKSFWAFRSYNYIGIALFGLFQLSSVFVLCVPLTMCHDALSIIYHFVRWLDAVRFFPSLFACFFSLAHARLVSMCASFIKIDSPSHKFYLTMNASEQQQRQPMEKCEKKVCNAHRLSAIFHHNQPATRPESIRCALAWNGAFNPVISNR